MTNWSWSLVPADEGAQSITFTATDARGVTSTVVISTTIAPAPAIEVDGPALATAIAAAELDTELSINFATYVSGGVAPLTYSADVGSFSTSTWTFTPTVRGVTEAVVTVTDNFDNFIEIEIAIQIPAWSPQLYIGSAFSDAIEPGLEAGNIVPATFQTDWGVMASAQATPLTSPDAYLPEPVRVSGLANFRGVNYSLGALAEGETMFVSIVFIPGTSGEMRVLFRDPSDGANNFLTWLGGADGSESTTNGGSPALASAGWEDVSVNTIVGADGVTYHRFTAFLTITKAGGVAAAEFRIGSNGAAYDQYVDLYRAGATFGLSAPTVSENPSLANNATISTLTLDTGAATGDPTPVIRWQRSDDGLTGWADISGATGETYDYSAEVIGKFLRAGVVWTNSQGSAAEVFTSAFEVTAIGGLVTTGLYNLTSMPVVEELMVVSPTQVVAQFDEKIYRDQRLGGSDSTETQRLNDVSDTTWTTSTHTSATRAVSAETPLQLRFTPKSSRRMVLLTLGSAMVDDDVVTVTASNAESLSMTYGPGALSAMVHIPHHGFTPNSPKRALVGTWIGDAISLTSGKKWAILDASTDAEVTSWGFNDTKSSDTLTTTHLHDAADTIGFSPPLAVGHDVDYIDFSDFTTPGRYKIAVEDMGASRPFSIHADVHLPLARHVGMGFLACAHSRSRTSFPASIRYPQDGDWVGRSGDGAQSRITGRTAAAWFDGLRGVSTKLWEGNTGATFADGSMLVEQDATLAAHSLDTFMRGFQDAGDFDVRPLHADSAIRLFATAIALNSWIGGVDLGWDEAFATPYSETIRGGAIAGTVNISHLDRIALHWADFWAALQITDTIYDTDGTTPIWTPSDPVTDSNNWYGAVRGAVENGAYVGARYETASWATHPEDAANDGNYAKYGTRPDPFSTYAAAGVFAAAALRFKQLGDAKMQQYYTVRAERAWDWARANEWKSSDVGAYDWLTKCDGQIVWDDSYRTAGDFSVVQWETARGNASAGLYALTGLGAAWTDTAGLLTVGGLLENDAVWDTTATNGVGGAQMLMLACREASLLHATAAGNTAFGAKLDTLEAGAITRLEAVHDTVTAAASGTDQYLLMWSGQSNRPLYSNSFNTPITARSAPGSLLPVYGGLSAAQKRELWELIEAEVAFVCGRNPTRRAHITGFGFDGPRMIHHSDWRKIGLTTPPPGLIPFGYETVSTPGFKRNNVDNWGAFPAAFRILHGQGSLQGEFNIALQQAHLLIAVLMLHHMEIEATP